ncbi:MAG: LptA/OstA family protein [Candidatus Omnitrophota bacterium]|nr:LptA/OstA family protein [Candidatus Omnitrophota bacterium]
MHKKINITIFLFIFALILSDGIFAQDSTQNSSQKINDFYLSNVKEDGTKDWEVKGKEATIRDKYVDINNMEGKYFSNKDTIFVKSEKAELNRESKDANLSDNVELKIPDKEGNYMIINCDGPLEMRYNDGIAIFNKNVVVDSKDGKLFSDKATVFFDAKDKTKLRMVAEGHVKIVKDDNVAFCDKVTYVGQEKNITLEGNPRVVYFTKKNEAIRN